MFFVILVDDDYCVAIHDLSPVLTALFSFELGGFNNIPFSNFKCSQNYVVPGFNKHLKDLHDKARQCYVTWRDAGKSRNDATQSDMRVCRLQLKYVLRCCRANEDMHRADALAQSLKDRNWTYFWKDVQKMASSKIPLAAKVYGRPLVS